MINLTNQIVCADVLDTLEEIPDGAIRVFVTSPPYNLRNSSGNGLKHGDGGLWPNAQLLKGYEKSQDNIPYPEYVRWQRRCLHEMLRIIPDDGAIFYNHKWRVQKGLLQDRSEIVNGFPVRQVIIWQRKGGFNFNPGYFVPTYEVIYMICKPKFKLAKGGNSLGDVWSIAQTRGINHPAAFPVEIPSRVIRATGAKLIADPFMGSGQTALAALENGVAYFGIDHSQQYCNLAHERISQWKKMEASKADE